MIVGLMNMKRLAPTKIGRVTAATRSERWHQATHEVTRGLARLSRFFRTPLLPVCGTASRPARTASPVPEACRGARMACRSAGTRSHGPMSAIPVQEDQTRAIARPAAEPGDALGQYFQPLSLSAVRPCFPSPEQ